MSYKGPKDFNHQQQPKIGLLITNLGTPAAPTTKALRDYLGEFLSDPRVVEFPRLLWKLVLHGVILRIRPARSAEAYQSVWTDEGSPLMLHTQAQRDALAEVYQQRFGDAIEVRFAMRYGSPAIASVIDEMLNNGVRKLLVLPLYPQYSASTSGSTFDAIAKDFVKRRWLPDLRFISHYHDFPPYIDALAASVQAHWACYGRADKLVMSFHGIPKRYLNQGDPYHCECYKTSRLLAEKLGLGENDYITTFQSRFGREEWLKPYTDATLKQLPGEGVKSVQVICPGFSADCLETIEEIDEENREYFIEAGGERYEYIAALNAQPVHIEALAQLIDEQLQGWGIPASDAGERTAEQAKRLEQI